jgi:hypothetical protein
MEALQSRIATGIALNSGRAGLVIGMAEFIPAVPQFLREATAGECIDLELQETDDEILVGHIDPLPALQSCILENVNGASSLSIGGSCIFCQELQVVTPIRRVQQQLRVGKGYISLPRADWMSSSASRHVLNPSLVLECNLRHLIGRHNGRPGPAERFLNATRGRGYTETGLETRLSAAHTKARHAGGIGSGVTGKPLTQLSS